MLHPHTRIQYINDEIGHGIFAKQYIPKGTIIWCLDKLDRLLTAEELSELNPLIYDAVFHYVYRNKDGKFVAQWDAGRFMNHSYTPNCIITPLNLEIAIRDIQPDEQLTCDYGTLNIDQSYEYPGAPTGRSGVCPDDLLRHYPLWDKQIQDALQHYNTVPQPLLNLVPVKTQQRIQAIIQGTETLESIASLYFNQNHTECRVD